ncbi:MAG: hypothetical protein JSV86_17260 [Gemmatimonadota bacterium]|nr:MAG: hypothetical protein JSV86_17260 [Gemmatimonadota bacterium]
MKTATLQQPPIGQEVFRQEVFRLEGPSTVGEVLPFFLLPIGAVVLVWLLDREKTKRQHSTYPTYRPPRYQRDEWDLWAD